MTREAVLPDEQRVVPQASEEEVLGRAPTLGHGTDVLAALDGTDDLTREEIEGLADALYGEVTGSRHRGDDRTHLGCRAGRQRDLARGGDAHDGNAIEDRQRLEGADVDPTQEQLVVAHPRDDSAVMAGELALGQPSQGRRHRLDAHSERLAGFCLLGEDRVVETDQAEQNPSVRVAGGDAIAARTRGGTAEFGASALERATLVDQRAVVHPVGPDQAVSGRHPPDAACGVHAEGDPLGGRALDLHGSGRVELSRRPERRNDPDQEEHDQRHGDDRAGAADGDHEPSSTLCDEHALARGSTLAATGEGIGAHRGTRRIDVGGERRFGTGASRAQSADGVARVSLTVRRALRATVAGTGR